MIVSRGTCLLWSSVASESQFQAENCQIRQASTFHEGIQPLAGRVRTVQAQYKCSGASSTLPGCCQQIPPDKPASHAKPSQAKPSHPIPSHPIPHPRGGPPTPLRMDEHRATVQRPWHVPHVACGPRWSILGLFGGAHPKTSAWHLSVHRPHPAQPCTPKAAAPPPP